MELRKPHIKGWGQRFWFLFCGMCMGAADIIPGVSGGTMAFILGFYEELIGSIKRIDLHALKIFFTLQFKAFSQHISGQFLFLIFFGISLSFITLSHFFTYLLGHEVYRIFLFSIFFGLILGSVVFCAKQIERWQPLHLMSLLTAAAVAFVATSGTHQKSYSQGLYDINVDLGQIEVVNYDSEMRMIKNVSAKTIAAMFAKGMVQEGDIVFNHHSHHYTTIGDVLDTNRHQTWLEPWLIGCGVVASCAMLLPGISGSYLLVILGVYPVAIGAVADFVNGIRLISFDSHSFFILANLAIGIFVGIILFSRVVSWLLTHFHNLTIAALVGFMLGALHAVWPYQSYIYVIDPLKLQQGPQLHPAGPLFPDLGSPIFWGSLWFLVGGIIFVVAAEMVAERIRTSQQ